MRGDRAMTARAAQGGEDLTPALLGDHDRVEAPASQVLHHAAGLADAVLDTSEKFGVLVDEELRALVASRLFVREDRETRSPGAPPLRLRLQHGVDHHRHATLHIQRAPAPQVAVDDLSAKRLVRPVLVDGGDNVDVALEQERRSLAPAPSTAPPDWSGRANSHNAGSICRPHREPVRSARPRCPPGLAGWWCRAGRGRGSAQRQKAYRALGQFS